MPEVIQHKTTNRDLPWEELCAVHPEFRIRAGDFMLLGADMKSPFTLIEPYADDALDWIIASQIIGKFKDSKYLYGTIPRERRQGD